MMPTTAVSWLFLVFATLQSVNTIQVAPDSAISSNKTTQTQYTDHELNYSENETFVGDSELSASERNRRLVPYMAFYLPPPEFPINQKYLVQRPKQTQQQQAAIKAQHYAEHAVPQTAPGAIPIPTAYVHMKVPAAATGADLQYHQQQQKHQHFPPSAGEVYHSIAYGGQHPIPTNLNGNPIKTPMLHATGPGPLTTATHYKDINGNDHKSVLVYQPSAVAHQQHSPQRHPHQQQLPPLQQQYPRQRPKQSKFNLTPFTSSNTVPGHFIPIIYTPLSATTNNDANIRYNSNNQEITDEQQEQQQQYQQHRQQKQQQQPHEIVHHSAEYPLPAAAASSGQTGHPRAHQVQFLAVTATPPTAAAATHPTSRPIYHVFNEPSESLLSQSSPSQQQQESLHHQYQQQHQQLLLQQQQQQQEQQQQPLSSLNSLKQNHQHYSHSHTATNLKHPQFHPPKSENFFDTEQFVNADNVTPQQKYVQYLQQRLRYNKQQKQQHSKDRQREEQQNYKQQFRLQQLPQQHQPPQQQQQEQQYYGEQQPAQIFVISSTASPVEEIEQGNGGGHLSEMQHSAQIKQQQQKQLNYPQYNAVGHTVYQSSKMTAQTNPHPQSQAQQHQHQQVLHTPARRPVAVDELETQQQQHPRTQMGFKQQRPQLVEQYEKIPPSAIPPQYIDYLFEEPKQSLEDEHQQQHHRPQHPTATPHPTHLPPQAAYIIVTTAAPHPPDSPTRQHYGTTPRPIYNNQPTLRLQLIKTQNDRQPTNSPPINEHSIPPKYIYVTKKPDYSPQPPPPATVPTVANNHKPTYDYEEYNDAKPAKQPTAPATDAHIKPAENYLPQQHAVVEYQQRPVETVPHSTQHQQQKQEHLPAALADPNQLPDIRSSSLADILHKLQASNHLPQTLTPDNIDNSIKTLITILNNLKQSQTIVANPPQHHEKPHPAAEPDYDYTTGSDEEHGAHPQDTNVLTPVGTTKRPGPNTGRPGVDYPNYAEIPATTFDCTEQRYKGFFGDPETNCQVWHYCDLNGGKASFLCPNGTIFSQIALTCDWWFNVKCSTTSQLYVLNERLYKYILPFTPKFPEDYSGPIVDKYLALKFQEMEEKMRVEKQKAAAEAKAEEQSNPTEAEVDTTTISIAAQEHHSINSLVGEQSSERNLLIDDEVDDISQRGSVDTFDSTTPTTATTREAEIPLSLKPIVVSSTVEPEEQIFVEQNAQSAAQELQDSYEDNNRKRPKQQPLMEQQKVAPRETTKISVEKVEVIEIKSDGTSGHLTPTMIFNNDDTKR